GIYSGYKDYPVTGLYVHPRTGLLTLAPQKRWKGGKSRTVTRLSIGEKTAYQMHNKIWYRVTCELISVNEPSKVWDVFEKKMLRLTPGNWWVDVEKKQCNRAELAHIRELLQREEAKRKL